MKTLVAIKVKLKMIMDKGKIRLIREIVKQKMFKTKDKCKGQEDCRLRVQVDRIEETRYRKQHMKKRKIGLPFLLKFKT